MKFVDIDLTEQPVDLKDFKYIAHSEQPKIIIGTPVHHKYDQQRLIFSNKVTHEDILFLQTKPTIKANFFRGLDINISKKYSDLIDDLHYFSNNLTQNRVEEYKNILKQYNLSCDSCFSYLSENIMPIDGKHINKLTSKYKIENLYETVFETKNCFQCYGSLNIFILFSNYLCDEIYENIFQPEENISLA